MAMVPERSNLFHNFSMPNLKWGSQRLLRCMKMNPNEVNNGTDQTRPKVILHLHRGGSSHGSDEHLSKNNGAEVQEDGKEVEVEKVVEKPWNLRTRRSACKSPNEKSGKSVAVTTPPKVLKGTKGLKASTRLKGAVEKKERGKFTLALAKEDIEEDYLGIFGVRPPRRPKKRVRAVQKQLDALFPGSSLYEITADSYRVPDELES